MPSWGFLQVAVHRDVPKPRCLGPSSHSRLLLALAQNGQSRAKERAEGSFVILRTYAGGQVHYGPFAEDGVEAAIMHLGSALAMTAMRYQTVLRGANFGGRLHEQGLPEETPDKRREIAEQLAEAMARDGISRELFADMLEFLGIPSGPTGPPDARLAHLLKAIEEAFGRGRTATKRD